MSIKLFFIKITNHIILTYELVIGNRRLIIPSMIGLIIALTVISQSGILIEYYRQEIFEEVVFGSLDYYYFYSVMSLLKCIIVGILVNLVNLMDSPIMNTSIHLLVDQ